MRGLEEEKAAAGGPGDRASRGAGPSDSPGGRCRTAMNATSALRRRQRGKKTAGGGDGSWRADDSYPPFVSPGESFSG
jgi:hypothetical protein